MVIASRTVHDYEALKSLLVAEPVAQITEVVSGGAAGVDAMGERWARENGKKLTVLPAEWSKYGKKAGMIRNAEIVKLADKIIALWDGESKGTAASIRMAQKAGKPLKVHICKPDAI